jgi:hypothetical protein
MITQNRSIPPTEERNSQRCGWSTALKRKTQYLETTGEDVVKKLAISLMITVMIMIFGSTVHAGFVDPALNSGAAPFNRDFINTQNQHQCNFDDNPAAPTLTMTENIKSFSLDDILLICETDEDPTFTVIKIIENDSGITWTSYILTLFGGGGAIFIKGSASASGNKLQTVHYLHTAATKFTGLKPVAPSEFLTLSFNINVPTTGLFNSTLTQEPVPEPATMSLLWPRWSAVLPSAQTKMLT